MEEFPYEVSSTEKVRNEERELESELAELKSKIEENEMVYGIIRPRNVSSVPLPKDTSYFRKERELVIKRGMEVCQARPVTIQAEAMQEEMELSHKSDYSIESLPLLMHQFFLDRIQQLVQCKHMHMLRWTRFHEHTSTLEALYPYYQEKLKQIMLEYNDCLQRTQRLAAARESYFNNDTNAAMATKKEDLLIYLRWLICHLHSNKRFNQYMRVLQWLPVTHQTDFAPTVAKEPQEDETNTSTRIPSKYQDDTFLMRPSSGLSMSRPPSSRSALTIDALSSRPPTAPHAKPSLLSTNPLPSTQITFTLAAAGGGLASDEFTHSLPLHSTELDCFRSQLAHMTHLYGIDVDVENMSTAAEEMELYATVNRKFRHVFIRQEQMRTFKTYDRFDIGQENWGADSSIHAIKQDSNWRSFVTIKPLKNPQFERKMVELRAKRNMDELLRVEAKFMEVAEADKVQDALREHAAVVREPVQVQAVTITTGHGSPSRRVRSSPQIASMWKMIYTNPELYNKEEDAVEVALQELEDKEATEKGQRSGRPSTSKKRRDSYNYVDTVQLLGLDEGEQDSNDPASIQGAYISFLQLRHLRVRDLQRTCLGVLNYFRSVERTLTINDGGLSLEAGTLKKTSPQNHRRGVIDGTQGGGSGLGSHHYLHFSPKDFKLSETDFMEFSDIENHDDFYSYDEGRVHVQDQRGYYVIYDAALEDLGSLEEDLLLIASHYIEKDKDLRSVRTSSARKRQQQQIPGDFDVPSYSHQEVDRFGVLLDLWTNEAAYLESKKELLDCYLEAYHHVFDRDEKRILTQELTNIMYRRPRFDLSAPYFVKCYRTECVCLRLQADLVKSVLDRQIEEQREHLEKIHQEGTSDFGIPPKVVPKQPISVNMSRSALKNVYLLEFHPSLAVASRLPEGLRHAYWELWHQHKPETCMDMILLEKKLLETAITEWHRMENMGASFSSNVQKDIFGDDFVENPVFVSHTAMSLVEQLEKEQGRQSQKDRQHKMLASLARVLQMISVRHRLLDAAWESEILSKVYRKQAKEMGFDDYHLFLRFVQFEYASHKDSIVNAPIFITAIQEDDSMVDRVTPKSLFLAIHELDESSVGRLSFTSPEHIQQVLKGGGVENMETMLMTQVVHKNGLVCAVQQAHISHSMGDLTVKTARPSSPMETKSEKSSTTAMTNLSVGTGVTSLATKLSHGQPKTKKSPEAFVSIQLEKNPMRDRMLNEFVKKKQQMEVILKNPVELAKLKRNLICDYCRALQQRVAQYSLRGQIIAYYNSILGLLEDFPLIRDNYFMHGEPNEKKSIEDTVQGLEVDSKSLKKRPRRVLTEDGQHVLNVWFVPHYTEALVMYKKLDDAQCCRALGCHLRIVASIHDMLQYLCAHSRLGSSTARMGSLRTRIVTADWGGTEGIGTELLEIQKQINHLHRATDPEEVSQFLVTRRDVMFLEFDAAVRHSIRDTFLATNNTQGYQTITDCMHHALDALSDSQRPAHNAVYLNVPEPLEPRDARARLLFPCLTFINRHGPYPVHFWQWRQVEYHMRLCLAGLKEVDKHTANGEILGLSLLMEDVLTSGEQDRALYAESEGEDSPDEDSTDTKSITSATKGGKAVSQDGSVQLSPTASKVMGARKALSRNQQPFESLKLLHSFLCLWKQLEVYKHHWGRQRLGVQHINTPALYRAYCKEYRKEVLYPILQSVARRYGQSDLYEGIVSDDEPLVMPRGASEMEIRTRQLAKLLENQECQMLKEVRRKLNREMNLVLAERQREEDALPTDLWKKPSMKETVTINRPHIAEDFIDHLMSEREDQPDQSKVVFSSDHLNACLAKLSNDVMIRERHNYENYSMYYENVLRTHHQLLYQREQETKQLQDQLRTAQNNTMVEVQCQLAETSQDLILEVVALRAKIEEMREDSMNQERIVRERVKEEYDLLVHNMFSSSFDTMQKFDKYRVDVVADIKKMIDKAKESTITEMDAKKDKTFAGEVDKSNSGAILQQVEKVRSASTENHHMNVLLMKTRAMNIWRQINDQKRHSSEVALKTSEAEKTKRDFKKLRELHQAEVILLQEQLEAVRNALRVSSKECDSVRKELEKELKAKKEKQHMSQQKAQSQRQLMEARRNHIDKLITELDDKETKLRDLSDEQEKTVKIQSVTQEKTKREVDKIRKQLTHERNLKLDAFQRVDELQTHVHDVESVTLSRPQTAIGMAILKSVRESIPKLSCNHVSFLEAMRTSKSRVTSATTTRRPPSRATASSVGWAPPVQWPANRSLTPAGDLYASVNNTSNGDVKKIQRPKTTMGRLRSRIADQLLYELEPPDHHETLVQLKQIEGQVKGKVC